MSLFINGDDFGMSKSCTLAIAEAIEKELIDGTTMMANGEYFDEAAALAASLGFAGKIGVHLNLTEGAPLTEEIKTVSAFVAGGRFHKEYLKKPCPLTEREQAAVFIELAAQIKRIRQAGINVIRADSHHYIHTFVHIAPLVAEVCRKNGIKRIRINRTFDTPERPIMTDGRIDNSFWCARGFETTAHFGRMSDVELGKIPDDTEIMVHPDYDKNGVLIDRTGTADGYPTGVQIKRIK